jgi:serine/threonine protein kinase/Tol biopolymer transport system component
VSEDFQAVSGGLTAGSRIAGYLLEEQIGQGGMAVVFRALDVRLQRQVALKILAPALTADEEFRQRFIRESQAAAAVDDPHIIPVFEAGEASGVLFIAMRLVRGGDVGTLLRRDGPMQPSRAAAIVAPVADALDAAHEAGLVHRDVKPANMLLDVRSGRPEHVYLSDFGLSKAALAGSMLTGTGLFLGTLDYSAPEQIEGRPVDGRADQYALASAAFELLTGTPPFQRDDLMAVMYARLSEPPPALSSRRHGLPEAVDRVLARALARAPADRYGSCREFSNAFRAALGIGQRDVAPGAVPDSDRPATEVATFRPVGAGGVDHASVSAAPATEVTPASRRIRRRSVTWAIAVIAILALGGTAIALMGGRPPKSPAPAGGCGERPSPRTVNWSAGRSSRPLLELPTSRANIVEGMAFSSDGTTLAVGTFGGSVYLLNAITGHRTRTLTEPGSRGLLAVSISCDGKLLAAADRNGSTYLWDLASSARAAPPVTLTDPASNGVRAVAFSPDGKTLATGDTTGSTHLWDLTSGAPTAPAATLTDSTSENVQAVAFSPGGKMLATGDANGSTYLWDLTSGAPKAPRATLTDPASGGVQAVAFSPDGKALATGDANASSYLWDISRGTASSSHTLANPGASGAYGTVALAFSPDSKILVAGGYTGQTYLWDTSSRSLITTLPDPGSSSGEQNIQAVAFSPHGTMLATGDTRGGIYLWTAR